MSYKKLILQAMSGILGTVMMINAGAENLPNADGDIMQIAPCPKKPNCVSSLDKDPGHGVEPLRHDKLKHEAVSLLRSIIKSMPRSKIVRSTPQYLRAEFRSAIFGFVDDVELLVGETPGMIHVRSASRVGYWDLGVNRRRVEKIRERFSQSN